MNLICVGRGVITASGGASQPVSITNKMSGRYLFVMRSTGASAPEAGTTAVTWKPSGGDVITMKQDGLSVSVNPTDLQPFSINCPVDTVYFTPSSWTANSEITVDVFAEVY